MKRRLTILTLTTLAAVALIGVVSTAPSPALAGGATQISGVAFFDEAGPDCARPLKCGRRLCPRHDWGLGRLSVHIRRDRRKLAQRDLPRDGNRALRCLGLENGTFRTTYRFEAKYEDVANLAGEIFGRCQHPIVEGSGTGIFEGVSGRLDFKDEVESGTFLYRGHLRY